MCSKINRLLGIVLLIAANYMLWQPWITLLDMIPFVGWLLSGVAAVAAFIWSFIVGLNTGIFVIAVAWIFFRPLFGICLLLTFGIVIFLIFFFPWEKVFPEDGDGKVKETDDCLDCDDFEEVDNGPASSTSSGNSTSRNL